MFLFTTNLKNIFFWMILIITCIESKAQESYCFSVAQPAKEKNHDAVDEKFFGIYKAQNSAIYYECNKDGIWVVSTIYSAISKETIRESSKYIVRNGYLFGVIENDSVPYVLDNDKYYFGIKNREQIIGGKAKNKLKKISADTYILNYFENDRFVPAQISFKGKSLEISYFDYETESSLFKSIKIQNTSKEGQLTTVLLSPSPKEWDALIKKGIFGSTTVFTKEQ